MSRGSRRGGRRQTQKTITPFTVSNTNMADEAEDTTPTNALTLQDLRRELQAHKDEIKAEIGSSCRELKGEITTLRSETKADMKSLHEEPTGELTKLHTAQTETKDQLEEMGTALSDTMDRVATLEKTQQELAKKCKSLQEKCQDLENRSRRRNVRIVGVEENSEKGNMLTFIPAFLRDVLGGDIFSSPVVLNRAHRSLGPKPAPGGRPRTIVVCFHYYTDKQKVLDAAKARGKLFYNGRQVHLFPDVSPEVGKMRTSANARRQLREAGIKYAFVYPAVIKILNQDGSTTSLSNMEEINGFIKTIPK
uniref:L1 transposable element RRM domain-containing protein n=1 Tax=Neogobius melanostomus TaxID=47308 RepID=A0A8C6TSQ3_9GOBI